MTITCAKIETFCYGPCSAQQDWLRVQQERSVHMLLLCRKRSIKEAAHMLHRKGIAKCMRSEGSLRKR